MVTLRTVEIPGLREALKREAKIRDTAFLDGLELVCGVEVAPLSLRRLIWLEQAQNGLIVPWKWDSDAEAFAHAVHFLYMLQPSYSTPASPKESFWRGFAEGWREVAFARRFRKHDPATLIQAIMAWIGDAFMDAPSGGGSEVAAPNYASYPVYLVDLFAEAGLPFTYAETMDMPLCRLWQFWRVADRRVNGRKLSNPSDQIVTDHLAKGAA